MEIILKRTFLSSIHHKLNRVLQTFGNGCGMRTAGARTGGKLLPAQFAALAGTAERTLQDRPFANQTIENMHSFFGSHKTYNDSAQVIETGAQYGTRRQCVRQPSSTGNA